MSDDAKVDTEISQEEFLELVGNAIEVTITAAILDGDWTGFEGYLAEESTNRWEAHRAAEGIS